jgi:hypothetical protein
MYRHTFNKLVNSSRIKIEIAASNLPEISHINTINNTSEIFFLEELTEAEENILSVIVNNHVFATAPEQLAQYLSHNVFPFVNNLLITFAAENIALGITQAGKTADVLGLFQKPFDIGASHLVSLKASLDTGSLYVARDVIQYVRDNPGEYTGLSPYVTDSRLLKMKNDIEAFLGLTLST